ncbi:hypothetical protein L873DRAFT_1788936 [Choiromyces venosus 120613-1]|uniref:Uncharacterized protein n=1 Tax=Choiromyces venosus 120613-1 TaxID=1336337 RepID=A0A3N4K3R6_9PEZI|nr:hypothetical protein L873DRAFT_1788936 [Choiromyces venosus 120613-1]
MNKYCLPKAHNPTLIINLDEDNILPTTSRTTTHLAISDGYSDSISESDDGTESDDTLASSEEEEDDRTEKNTGMQIKWKSGADKNLRGAYGVGSKSSRRNQQENLNEFRNEAIKSYNIAALWKRQRDLHLAQPPTKLADVPCGGVKSEGKKEKLRSQQVPALKKLATLLRRKCDQIARFGVGGLRGHLLRRYEMVHAFLHAQLKRPNDTRKSVALAVAHTFGRGEYTARWIIRWEPEWISNSTIPAAEGHGKASNKWWVLESLFCDEGLQLLIRDYVSSAKDGITSRKLTKVILDYISNHPPNHISGETSSDLPSDESVNTEAESLGTIFLSISSQSIANTGFSEPAEAMDLNTIFSSTGLENDHPQGSLQRCHGVVARTVRRWLRKLGFDWRDIKKGVYTDGHERDDVRKYRETFLLHLESYWP